MTEQTKTRDTDGTNLGALVVEALKEVGGLAYKELCGDIEKAPDYGFFVLVRRDRETRTGGLVGHLILAEKMIMPIRTSRGRADMIVSQALTAHAVYERSRDRGWRRTWNSFRFTEAGANPEFVQFAEAATHRPGIVYIEVPDPAMRSRLLAKDSSAWEIYFRQADVRIRRSRQDAPRRQAQPACSQAAPQARPESWGVPIAPSAAVQEVKTQPQEVPPAVQPEQAQQADA